MLGRKLGSIIKQRKLAGQRLDDRTAAALKKPGRHNDGNGLYLVVAPSGSKAWLYMFRWEGKLKEMGLGGYPLHSLAEARKAAEDARKLVKQGRNPIEVRRQAKDTADGIPEFGAFAEEVIVSLESQWRNEKHRSQWRNTLSEYAAGIWQKRVDLVDVEDVLTVLRPVWLEKPETASRLRGRVEKVLDAATAKGLRQGLNPARWRGHLDHLLPKPQKLSRGHHAAMPYDQVAAFVADLRSRDAITAMAIEFLILCTARSGEVMGMTWEEVDLEAAVWTVPGARMKAGREHRVPLTARAMEILEKVRPLSEHGEDGPTGFVFRGTRGGPLSVMAMTMQMRRMEKGHFTIHGFRSAFRDWCGEESSFPREIAEAALAHTVGDATERAYRRGDALEKRRKLMEAWASYIEPKAAGGTIVQFMKR